MQIDEAVVLPHADGALIQPHAVEAQEALRRLDDLGDAIQFLRGDAGDLAKLVDVLLHEERAILLEAARVLDDEVGVHRAEVEQHAAQRVQAGRCRRRARPAGRCRPAAVAVRRGSMTMICCSGRAFLAGLDAVERDRMRLGHVAAHDDDHVGEVDVVVAGRRPVAAEAGAIARDGGRHAQPAVRVGVVAAEMPLEELADQVDRFGVELAAAVEGDRFGAVGVEDVGEDLADVAKCGGPIDPAKAIVSAEAELRMGQAIGGVDGRAELGALGADAAEVGRRGFDAAATVGADRFTKRFQGLSLRAVP